MKEEIRELLNKTVTIDLVEAVFSNPTKKEVCKKVKVRPLLLKEQLKFQVTRYCGNQVFHENLEKEQLLQVCEEWFLETDVWFKQLQLETRTKLATVLISKKGKVTVKEKKKQQVQQEFSLDLTHNRKKHYILQEGKPVPFLIDLGVMTKAGKIVRTKYDKFRQINRFLEFIEDVLPYLPKDRELTILDFGCGKSYLTFAMYYYLHELKQYPVRIIGLDLKRDVIAKCNTLSEQYGYDRLNFFEGDIASYEGVEQVDMVVTLHACDTATDHALYKAISWGAQVILSVPCCQHELNQTMKPQGLEPLFRYGIIKERSAALFTDALRAKLLESQGYKAQILEFIEMEHTPKNLLIRAVKQKKKNPAAMEEYTQLTNVLGADLTLGRLLREENE